MQLVQRKKTHEIVSKVSGKATIHAPMEVARHHIHWVTEFPVLLTAWYKTLK